MKVCKVSDCNRITVGRGYCSMHYQRFMKFGCPLTVKEPQMSKLDFIVDDNGCFIITSLKPDGFGRTYTQINGRQIMTHRFVYEEMFGEIPEGLVVRHKCDVPGCVNPEHMELGTQQDNMRDMDERGRRVMGEDITWSRLNNEDVIKIRKLHSEKKHKMYEIADMYGVAASTISAVINKRSWKHL